MFRVLWRKIFFRQILSITWRSVSLSLRSNKAEVVSCLICDTEFIFKKNLYLHLKKLVYTAVKLRLWETPDRTSLIRTHLSDLEDLEPNPWVEKEEALEPEPKKGTSYTPPGTRVHGRVSVCQLESRYYPPRRGCKALVQQRRK